MTPLPRTATDPARGSQRYRRRAGFQESEHAARAENEGQRSDWLTPLPGASTSLQNADIMHRDAKVR